MAIPWATGHAIQALTGELSEYVYDVYNGEVVDRCVERFGGSSIL